MQVFRCQYYLPTINIKAPRRELEALTNQGWQPTSPSSPTSSSLICWLSSSRGYPHPLLASSLICWLSETSIYLHSLRDNNSQHIRHNHLSVRYHAITRKTNSQNHNIRYIKKTGKNYHKVYLWLVSMLSMWRNQFCPAFHHRKVRCYTASFWWNLWWQDIRQHSRVRDTRPRHWWWPVFRWRSFRWSWSEVLALNFCPLHAQ